MLLYRPLPPAVKRAGAPRVGLHSTSGDCQSRAATNGSATGARRAPCPSPFSGQAAATNQRRGGRCQGRASAERSEGSLDRRSPPSR
jgi:hypothetical protein